MNAEDPKAKVFPEIVDYFQGMPNRRRLAGSLRLLAYVPLLFALGMCGWAKAAPAAQARSAAWVRSLSAAEAAKHPLASISGVVTFYDPLDRLLFVQDRTGAIFVDTDRDLPIGPGSKVEIAGRVRPDFTNTLSLASIRETGSGPLPEPKPANLREVTRGLEDCNYITLTGLIKSAYFIFNPVATGENEKLLYLKVSTAHGDIDVQVLHFAALSPDRLTGSTVRLTGVAAGYFNETERFTGAFIHVYSAKTLSILSAASNDGFGSPLVAISEVMRSRASSDGESLVRVRGSVTYYEPGHTLVVQDAAGGAILAMCPQTTAARTGDVVEVVGTPSPGQYSPILENGRFRVIRPGKAMEPVPAGFQMSSLGTFGFRLVSFKARLIGLADENGRKILHLAVNDRVIAATLPLAEGAAMLPPLQNGSLLSLAGICIVEAGGVWHQPQGFTVMLRGPGDIRVLTSPSWWTNGRLLLSLLATGALLFAICLWVSALRVRVARQKDELERSSNSREARTRVLEMIGGFEEQANIQRQLLALIQAQWPGSPTCLRIDDVVLRSGSEPVPNAAIVWSKEIVSGDKRSIGELTVHPVGRYAHEDPRGVLDMACNIALLAIHHRELYERLTYRSEYDALTGLPNRSKLESAFEEALARAGAADGFFAVAFLDLDSFKQINDQHGHKTGDHFLRHVSAALSGAARTGEVVARWGGDEFVVLSQAAGSRSEAEAFGRRLIEAVRQPVTLDGTRYIPSASVGIACYPEDDTTAEGLRQKADKAMYAAKMSGKDQTKLYSRRDCEPSEPRHLSTSYLRQALDLNLFQLHYQPVFSVGGRLIGFEALVRLHDPDLGIVPPIAFIEAAERSRLIVPIGEWVLREACAQGAIWSRLTGSPLRMSVNLSAVQIAAPDFCSVVSGVLAETGLRPEQLELELTETALLRDIQQSIERMEILRAQGVRFAIDDFGIGYCSLSYVQHLPMDTIKIDRSFTQSLRGSPGSLPVVRTILALASSFGAETVAEGIEDISDVPLLRDLGCSAVQGYAFSRPLPPDQIAPRLGEWLAAYAIDEQAALVAT